jgi:hypothetical protein
MRFLRASLTGLLLCAATVAVAAEFSSLEERMSQAQFHEAGLDKLSADELKTLNAWLRGHNAAGPAIAGGDRTGLRPSLTESGSGPIVSKLDGNFVGWSGRTQFKLANGQVWQQSESDSYDAPKMQNPQITIEQGLLGGWLLKVEGSNRSVHVTRLR